MKIKRPLFIISFSILVVIYAANTMPKSAIMLSLALFALFTAIHRVVKNKYTPQLVLCFISAIAGIMYLKYFNYNLSGKIENLSSFEDVVITCEVTGSANSSFYYIADVNTVNGERCKNFKVTVYSNDRFKAGTSLKITGKYSSFTPESNYLYNYSKGVFGYFHPYKTEILENTKTLSSFFFKIKEKLINSSQYIFSRETVAVALAMGLGDKTLLDKNTSNAFSFMGVSHVLVASGMHTGFIVAVLSAVMKIVPVKKKLKNIVTAIFIFIFMGIVGFTPSIIRSGCLIIAMLTGRNLFLEIDNYTVLAVIVLISVIINPYTANNASLLLSYSAYFGVVYRLEKSKGKRYGKIRTAFLVTTFAVVFSAPILALLGMDVTLLSPVFNLLLSPIIMAVCTLSFFLPIVYYLGFPGKAVCVLLAPINDLLIKLLILLSDYSAQYFGFAMVNLSDEKMIFIIMATVIGVAAAYIMRDSSSVRKTVIFSVPILALLCYNYLNKDIVTLKVFDGSSEPSYIISYENKNYLVMTEEINQRRFKYIISKENLACFDEIIVCSEKEFDTDFYSRYSNKIILVTQTDEYVNNIFSIKSDIGKKSMIYIINISDFSVGFNHKNGDLSAYNTDMYFFGSDAPRNVSSENYFYFYPVTKSNREIAIDKQATELYDTLTVKVNCKSGKYSIIKDVKNFGSQL